MRLLGKDAEGTSWLLSQDECGLLVSMLRLPPGPRSEPRLSLASRELQALGGVELADELEAHRASTRGRLQDLLEHAPGADTVEGDAPGRLLRLSGADFELFLQVLNEVRLAAWERLGHPNPPEPPDDLSTGTPEFRSWFELVVASRVQGFLLSAAFPG
jgi:hypothetical protein